MQRPNLYAIARFLRRLEEHPHGVTRARLQVLTRVNYDIFRRYLDLLEGQGYLTSSDGIQNAGLLAITPDGTAAAKRLRASLAEWLADGAGGL